MFTQGTFPASYQHIHIFFWIFFRPNREIEPRKLAAFKGDCGPSVFSRALPSHQKTRHVREVFN
jgi:hypothetical protein